MPASSWLSPQGRRSETDGHRSGPGGASSLHDDAQATGRSVGVLGVVANDRGYMNHSRCQAARLVGETSRIKHQMPPIMGIRLTRT